MSSPTKAEVFNNLIHELKNINTDKYRTMDVSSVSKSQFATDYKRWNEVVSKIIILTIFSKANQE